MGTSKYILNEVNETFKRFDVPFRKLILDYYDNEIHIRNRILSFIKYCLQLNGYTVNNKTFSRDNKIYRIDSDFGIITRTLTILIESIIEENIKTNVHNIEVYYPIALIKEINIISPKELLIDYEKVKADIKQIVHIYYESLEQSFIRNSEELNTKIFRKIYDRINIHLKQNGKEHLLEKYWLSIGHADSFHYFLDPVKTKILISYFKNNQKNNVSPFELIIALLKTPLDFKESLTAESQRQQRKKISKKWPELSYIKLDSKLLYVLAERELYPSDGHTTKALSESRNYILGIACSNDTEKEINDEIKLIEQEIDDLFIAGTKEYSIYFKTLKTFKHDLKNWKPDDWGKFTGGLLTEVFKGLSS